MPDSPFLGPTYALASKPASVQRTVNMAPVAVEVGNDRTSWVFKDTPGLVAVTTALHQCLTGPSWAQTVKTLHRHVAMYYLGGKFVSPYLADSGILHGGISYSLDGVNWADVPTMPGAAGHHVTSIAYGNGIFVSYGDNTQEMYQSSDVLTWALGTSNPNVLKQTNPVSIWFGAGQFVICGSSSAAIYVSPNASNQVTNTVPVIFYCGMYNAGNSLHYAGAAASGVIYTSSDLATWTLKGTPYAAGTPTVKKIVSDGANHFAALDGGQQHNYVAYSSDSGATWSSSTGLPALAAYYVDILYLASQGMWMLTDNNGHVFLSFDNCATWTAAAHDLNPFLGDNQNWWMAARPDGFLYAAVPVTAANGTVAAVGTC